MPHYMDGPAPAPLPSRAVDVLRVGSYMDGPAPAPLPSRAVDVLRVGSYMDGPHPAKPIDPVREASGYRVSGYMDGLPVVEMEEPK